MNPPLLPARRSCNPFVRYANGWLTLAISIAFILAAARVSADQNSASSFVIRNARVFDGEKIITGASVVVTDGQVAAVGSNVQAPLGAQVIDATGDTLMPGLIDSHVHIWNRDVLASALAFGVTTELDMFMRWREAKNWKEQESKGAFKCQTRRASVDVLSSATQRQEGWGFFASL